MEFIEDKITGRNYIKTTYAEVVFAKLNINKDNLLIGNFQNSARVLENDGTLIVFENTDPGQIYASITNDFTTANELNYNYARFFLEAGHAVLEMECRNCDNGKPIHLFTDLSSSLRKLIASEINKDSMILTVHAKDPELALKISFTDYQAHNVLSTINHLASLTKKDYDYVKWSHDCVSALTDIYRLSGFSRHYSEYLTDAELLGSKSSHADTHGKAFLHRYHDFSFKFDSLRPQIKNFMKATYGNNYAEKWKDLEDQIVNTTLLANFPEVQKRYEEALDIKTSIIPSLTKDYLTAKKISLTSELLKKLFSNLDLEVTNEDLYYCNSHKLKYEIFQLHKNSTYMERLFSFYEIGLNTIEMDCKNAMNPNYSVSKNYSEDLCFALSSEWDS
jgi:hypothetical protein